MLFTLGVVTKYRIFFSCYLTFLQWLVVFSLRRKLFAPPSFHTVLHPFCTSGSMLLYLNSPISCTRTSNMFSISYWISKCISAQVFIFSTPPSFLTYENSYFLLPNHHVSFHRNQASSDLVNRHYLSQAVHLRSVLLLHPSTV